MVVWSRWLALGREWFGRWCVVGTDPLVFPGAVELGGVTARVVYRDKLVSDALSVRRQPTRDRIARNPEIPLASGTLDPSIREPVIEGKPFL